MGTVFYAHEKDVFILKFVGDIRYTLSCSLEDFIDRVLERETGLDGVLIDLSETTCIDSTNLGILAKISRILLGRGSSPPTIYSTNQDINQTLCSVGFDQVFYICHDRTDCGNAHELSVRSPSRSELNKTLYKAHNLLCELNDDNRRRFRPVIEALPPTDDSPPTHPTPV